MQVELVGTPASLWSYHYNALGQLTEARDPEHQDTTVPRTSTRLNYDSLGRLARVDYPESVSARNGEATQTWESYSYDSLDRVTGKFSLGRPIQEFAYDARGRMVAQTTPDQDGSGSSMSAMTTQFTYNVLGQPLLVTNPLGSQSKYEYDTLGRLEKYHAPSQSAATFTSQYTSYAYNAAGQVVSTTDPLGAVATTSYDPRGQVHTQTLPSSSTPYQYRYDPAGRPIQTIDPLAITTATTYADGRVSSTVDGKGAAVGMHGDTHNFWVGWSRLAGCGH